MRLDAALAELPVIAILRGLPPTLAVDVAEVLIDSGIRAIETPLNSPDAPTSIARMVEKVGGRAAIGAGTVLREAAVRTVADCGCTFVVSPNTDERVIAAALDSGLAPVPGFATPTEAFRGLQSGAEYLKLFPADSFGPQYINALKAVLPADTGIIAVGGIDEDSMQGWFAAGVAGIGVGSSLYRPDRDLATLSEAANRLVRRYASQRK